ncbi:MAG: YneF family protein [Acholeplasmatales bacterium]|nr:YneF family protein [Acholeplasmatales bacterium]
MEFEIWQFILIILVVIIISVVVTFIVTRKLFQKQLKDNPPMSEAAVRAMMTQMGRTPSEKQVRAVMRSMNPDDGKEDKKKKKK